MIKSVHLVNFQSHPDSYIEFHKGINSFIGTSNHGKSGILRGLIWVFQNRPRNPKNFVSFWNRDKKGNPIDPTEVTIELENGVKITRSVSSDFNGYRIAKDGELIAELDRVDGDVPEEVSAYFNISEVNIQSQLDSHFLLRNTAGEVARFYNRIIHLDIIDRVLSEADSKKRELAQELKATDTLIKSLEKQVQAFDWLSTASELLAEAKEIDSVVNNTKEDIKNVGNLLSKLLASQETIESLSFLSKAEKLLEKIEKIRAESREEKEALSNLELIIFDYKKQSKIYNQNNNPAIKDATDLIEKIDDLEKIHESDRNNIKVLSELLINIKENEETAQKNKKEEARLKKLLPEICPLCGGTGGKDLCNF